jgi:hypothetical protein
VALLGAVTLETLGLMVNPLSRELLPMRLVLTNVGGRREGEQLSSAPHFMVLGSSNAIPGHSVRSTSSTIWAARNGMIPR